MRFLPAIIVILMCGAGVRAQIPAAAQPPGSAPEVAAAAASASDRLASDIRSERITSSVTVGMLVDRTASDGEFQDIVRQAQQVGQPRWLDEQTCQVRIDLAGSRVAHMLREIARANPKSSPLTGDQVERAIRDWDTRIFSATGSSTASIEDIRPPPGSLAWKDATDADIQRAVIAARQDAIAHVLASIAQVPLAGGKTVGDALAIPEVGATLGGWLGNRPMVSADFGDDRQVEVTISAPAAAVFDEFRALLNSRHDLSLPTSEKAWADVSVAISRKMATATGRGTLSITTRPTVLALPNQPPDWVDRQLDVSATGTGQNRLLAARAAESAAINDLRRQIALLPIGGGKTLADYGSQSPENAASIERILTRSAKVYSVDYVSDSSVWVRVSLDLQDLWQGLWPP